MTFAATPNGNPFAGLFTNTPATSPDQVARKRAIIAAMMPQFGNARTIGAGIGQLATGVMAGVRGRQLDRAESAGQAEATDFFNRLMGRAGNMTASTSGPMSVLGVADIPAWSPQPAAPSQTDVPGATGTNFSYDIPTPDTGAGQGGLSFGNLKPQLGSGPITGEAIVGALVDRGMTPEAAQGFAMNIADESAFNPNAVGDNGNAFGLAQWNGPRKAALLDFAAAKGVPASDPNVQLDYLMTELQGPESGAYSRIASAGTPQEAAVAVLNNFERPAEAHRARREASYAGGGMPAGSSDGQSGNITMSTQGAPSGPGLDELYQAMSNPWLNDQQRSVIASMISQQQQAADPMYQLQMQKAQLELAKMQQEAQKPIEVGGVLLDPTTYQPIFDSRKGQTPDVPSSFAAMALRAQAAGLQPGTPEYQKFMLNGGAGTGGEGPAAFQALHMQAIAAGFQPGSDEYKQFMATRGAGLVQEAKTAGEGKATAAAALSGAKATADLVSTQINALINDPYLPQMLGPIDARLPNVSAEAARVQSRIDQLQGGAFLQARQLLKGGGAITDYEGQKAEAAFVRMNQAQSVDDFTAALREFNDAVQQGYTKLAAQAGQTAPAAPQGGTVMQFDAQGNLIQ